MDRRDAGILQLSAELLADLGGKLAGKGWQPSRKEARQLLAALATADRDQAEQLSLALRRLKQELPPLVLPLLDGAAPPQRARLVKLLDEYLLQPGERARLVALLADADPRTERVAIAIAGRVVADAEQGAHPLEAMLVQRWPSAPPETRRALALALGQIGGKDARAVLAALPADAEPELRRLAEEAILKLDRRSAREESLGAIFAAGVPGAGVPIWLRCRRGLEKFLAEECGGEVIAPERVELRSNRSLERLRDFRLALDFVIPLNEALLQGPDPRDAAVVAALTDASVRALLRRLTHGPIRFRIEWADAGKRRAPTLKVAAKLRELAPELLNDPRQSLWQLDVIEKPTPRFELVPKALPDPRFDYRATDVVGASHPTIAAALAWVAEPRPDDVVWDPFVGGATELIEVARRQMVKQLYGSDLSPSALERARQNLDAAGVPAELAYADATVWVPPQAPTLIVSNPPMGRRVLSRDRVTELLGRFLPHAARVLRRGGRIAWYTPRPEEARAALGALGLVLELHARVDMGGFPAELQVLRKR